MRSESAEDLEEAVNLLEGLSLPFSRLSEPLERALKQLAGKCALYEDVFLKLITTLYQIILPQDCKKLSILLLALLGKGSMYTERLCEKVFEFCERKVQIIKYAFAIVFKNFDENEQQTFISRMLQLLHEFEVDAAQQVFAAQVLMRGVQLAQTKQESLRAIENIKKELGLEKFKKAFEKELIDCSRLYETFNSIVAEWVPQAKSEQRKPPLSEQLNLDMAKVRSLEEARENREDRAARTDSVAE